jgi:hypothetical protein
MLNTNSGTLRLTALPVLSNFTLIILSALTLALLLPIMELSKSGLVWLFHNNLGLSLVIRELFRLPIVCLCPLPRSGNWLDCCFLYPFTSPLLEILILMIRSMPGCPTRFFTHYPTELPNPRPFTALSSTYRWVSSGRVGLGQ